MIEAATQHDCVIVVVPERDSFVPAGAPLLAIHGYLATPDALRRHVELAREPDAER